MDFYFWPGGIIGNFGNRSHPHAPHTQRNRFLVAEQSELLLRHVSGILKLGQPATESRTKFTGHAC